MQQVGGAGGTEPTTLELTAIRRLDRGGATTVYRLRTGHRGLRAHPRSLADCTMCLHSVRPVHILQDCPIFTAQHSQTWPRGADLNTKPWGSAADPDQQPTSRPLPVRESEWPLVNATKKKKTSINVLWGVSCEARQLTSD